MNKRPSNPEILHQIALVAYEKEIKIRDGIINVLRNLNWNNQDAKKEATVLQYPIQQAIDEHLRTFPGRRLKEYIQRSPDGPGNVRPVPRPGKYRWTAIVQAKLMSLNPRDFEILLGNVIVGWECTDILITPPSRDGGIDFVGKLDLEAELPKFQAFTGPSLLEEQCVYLFGQAKCYHIANPVEIHEIEGLIGAALTLDRGGGTPTKDRIVEQLKDWGWQPNEPLIHAFVTSGRYRSTIPGFVRKHKCRVLDGEQVAQRVIQQSSPLRDITDVDIAISKLTNRSKKSVTIL